MIVSHTEQFKANRNTDLRLKKELVDSVLEFINMSSANGKCILCTKQPKLSNIEDTIEHKLCNFCISKIHTGTPLFSLKSRPPPKHSEIQRFLELAYGITGSPFSTTLECTAKTTSIEELEMSYIELKEFGKCTISEINEQLLLNMQEKIRRDVLKAVIKDQIRFKIRVFEEQLESLKDNYATALSSGNFEDSAEMKNVFFRIFESKIDLEERLGRCS